MRSVNFSGSSVSKLTLWQPASGKAGDLERVPVLKLQYQPLPAQKATPPAKLSWLARLKNAFALREEHVQWMEKAQSGLGLPASMSHSLLEKSSRGKGRS
jgi:hypothetical protein